MADTPRFALVVWLDRYELACLDLEQAEIERGRGNVMVIAKEDDDCMPHLRIEPAQSNPRRRVEEDDAA